MFSLKTLCKSSVLQQSIVVDPNKRQKGLHILPILLVLSVFSVPAVTHAGVFSLFAEKVKAFMVSEPVSEENVVTSQTMNILKPVVVDTETANSVDVDVNPDVENLQATYGALRLSTEEVDFPINDTISLYEVKKGDTLATVAKLYKVSKNTIIWANELKSENIAPGDTLVILPVTGIKHTIKKGDTVVTIAKKYKADIEDITNFNGLSKDAVLTVGDIILVPEGEIAVVAPKPKASSKIVKTKILDTYSQVSPDGFLIRPVNGGRRTQGIHGHNGIDIASSIGTPIVASAGGKVIIAKSSGYNGGYGKMVIIIHDNNIQTVYAHMNAVYVTSGQIVNQGQVIGELGNTGRSTGPHLHFEVRGAKNPF